MGQRGQARERFAGGRGTETPGGCRILHLSELEAKPEEGGWAAPEQVQLP